jgi:hypothetical protein
MNPVDKQLEAFNSKDIDAFLECYSDGIQAYMLESNELINNDKDQLKKTMNESFKTKPKAKTTVIERITQNNLIIDLEKIDDYVEGKTIKSIAIYEVKDGAITKIWFGGRTLE